MRRVAVYAAALGLVAAVAVASSGSPRTTWTHGYDVSWPQCRGVEAHHVPSGHPRYVVLGLTHGGGHTANPCLADQISWARDRGARIGGYLVPSYPTRAQRSAADVGPYGACHGGLKCRLRNDGAAQAADAIAVMRGAGLALSMVWVDVEFRHDPQWSQHDSRNRVVLRGLLSGLSDAGLTYGVYTTSYMWQHITGGWRLDVPNWLPAGNGSAATARSRCSTTGTGGRPWLVQFTREWDEDLTCRAMDAVPGRPGPLWPYRRQSLDEGSTGPAVAALQGALGLSQTGTYDVPTAAAVARFQVQNSLPVTTTVDADDWRALGAFTRIGGHPFRLLTMTVR